MCRRRQSDDNEGVWKHRRIEMLTAALVHTHTHMQTHSHIHTCMHARLYWQICLRACALICICVWFWVFKAGITSYKQPLLISSSYNSLFCFFAALRFVLRFARRQAGRHTVIIKAAYERWQHCQYKYKGGAMSAHESRCRAAESCQRQRAIGVNLHWQSKEQKRRVRA